MLLTECIEADIIGGGSLSSSEDSSASEPGVEVRRAFMLFFSKNVWLAKFGRPWPFWAATAGFGDAIMVKFWASLLALGSTQRVLDHSTSLSLSTEKTTA